MAKTLTISELVLLVALDHKNSKQQQAIELRLGYALAGAVLLDLAWRDALKIQDGACILNPQGKKLPAYLKKAQSILKNENEMPLRITPHHAFNVLSAHMPELKMQLLDGLVKTGHLLRAKSRVKFAFTLREYRLSELMNGIRAQKFKALMEDRLSASELVALQIAHVALLLEKKGGKNKIPKAMMRLETLTGMVGIMPEITGLVKDHLPDMLLADPHALPMVKKARSQYPSFWEWRGFWPEKNARLLQASDIYHAPLNKAIVQEMFDEYLLLENVQDNIKLREGGLEIKRPVSSRDGYQSFLPKLQFNFPLATKELTDILPQLSDAEPWAVDAAALVEIMQRSGYAPRLAQVKKKRLQLKLGNQVRAEFSTIMLDGRKFLTACIEGPDYDITHAYAHTIDMRHAQVMGYVEFLKQHTLVEADT